MTAITRRSVRCAIYTRVSTESGLDQDFNSLDAQYDAAQAYIRSQAHAGWTLSPLPNSLLTGKRTGNFVKSAHFVRF
jgi:hypothetical protein